MNQEVKKCQNCKQDFVIEPDDFLFYEKIKVPAPTFCPDCRQMRRYAWRNERVLYRKNCDLCGKSTVTIYSSGKPYKVYCPPCWWGDGWDAKESAKDFDFSRPFFEQFQELQFKVPRQSLLIKNCVNSDFTNHSIDNKNVYFSFAVINSENVLYSTNIYPAKDSADCYHIEEGSNEKHYECVDVYSSYQCQYSFLIKGGSNCYYCYDLRNCSNCFLSLNLRNKSYYFLNKQYTKEEYHKKVQEFNLGSYASRKKLYEQWVALIKNEAIHRFAVLQQTVNSSGNIVSNSKNTKFSFDANDLENCKFMIVTPDVKDSMDDYHVGFKTELTYENHAVIRSYNVLFTHLSYDNNNIQYCDSCHNSSDLFGCVGTKKGSHMILNKQYSKEEYESLKNKIIEHMKKTGEYGEFFPMQLSPFGYNETQGQIYMPLTKDEAFKRGLKWEDLIPGTFGKETVKPGEIPDNISDVPDTITHEVLRCASCTKNYNIVPAELDFYRHENIPIPRLCPDCRYKQRIALRPPRKLYHRQCMCQKSHAHHSERCLNEFETSYNPDRPEIVYCEQCYQAEVA